MIDLGPPPLWLPPAPAIIRPVGDRLLTPGYLPMDRAARRVAISDLVRRKLITREQAKEAMFLVLAVPGGGPPATIAWTASGSSTANLTTYTFAGHALGTEAAGRLIPVVVYSSGAGGTAVTISTMTIGGVSAAPAVASNDTATVDAHIWYAVVPTGTTGDIVITFSAARARCAIDAFQAHNVQSATPTDTGSASAADPISDDLNISAGGVAVGGALTFTTTTVTWTAGLTERSDFQLESAQTQSSASDAFADAQTGLTIEADFASGAGASKHLVLASWR